MKKTILLFTQLIIGLISGCSNSESLNCGDYINGESWQEDCNTCTCNEGNIVCTEIACETENNNSLIDNMRDEINAWKFNSNLEDYEQTWLTYLENENPNTRIILIKSDNINCEGCYDLFFKKDRNIIKIVVRDGQLKQQSTITDDIVPLIETPEICSVFGGEWNECPAPCTTDEEACTTQCNPPICEFDDTKIVYNQEGEECGGLDKGDCAFGLTCYYDNKEQVYGICQPK